MPFCQKCWDDAYERSLINGRSQSENYFELLRERMDKPCTPAQQRGEY
jgi:hypothetical protein